ncbi:hypothetical protein EDD21DRAFT_419901 [Dissophora ornata]|nr:hypothetical protein EDD21DRAFT_419901 [Dissophora ornata]
MSSLDNPAPLVTSEALRAVLEGLEAQERRVEAHDSQLGELCAEAALDDTHASQEARSTTLALFPELFECCPIVSEAKFYGAAHPKKHTVSTMSDYHYNSLMEYRTPSFGHLGGHLKFSAHAKDVNDTLAFYQPSSLISLIPWISSPTRLSSAPTTLQRIIGFSPSSTHPTTWWATLWRHPQAEAILAAAKPNAPQYSDMLKTVTPSFYQTKVYTHMGLGRYQSEVPTTDVSRRSVIYSNIPNTFPPEDQDTFKALSSFKTNLVSHTGSIGAAEFLMSITSPIVMTLDNDSTTTLLELPNIAGTLTGIRIVDAKELTGSSLKIGDKPEKH